jgi:hypothetical protein
MNKDEFVERANEKHNFKYDYSMVEYYNNKVNVDIICKEHGIFSQRPDSHIRIKPRGCPECSGRSKVVKTYIFNKDEFIDISNEKHNFKYDYSNIKCDNIFKNVDIICPVHGTFSQVLDHMDGLVV